MNGSRGLDLSKYDTDKIENGYLRWYDRELEAMPSSAKVLELGVKDGGSLQLWRDYFPHGTVTGLDKNLSNLKYSRDAYDRLQVFEGSQADPSLLGRIARERAPEGFDLIVDDASHVGWLSRESFRILFDAYLKPGGVYVVEDWTTGYWQDWSDGRTHHGRSALVSSLYRWLKQFGLVKSVPSDNHPYGMVGFVKELVDEQGARDGLRGFQARPPVRDSKFERMVIYASVAFIHKTAATPGGSAR